MKIAVTIWEERISPVFDASRQLLIVEIENARIGDRSLLVFDPGQPSALIRTLAAMDVRILICGAVSQGPAAIINTANITLIPFITGQVDRVLETVAKGDSLVPAFLMPGCQGSAPVSGKSSPP